MFSRQDVVATFLADARGRVDPNTKARERKLVLEITVGNGHQCFKTF